MSTTLDTSIAKTSLAAVKRQANIASGTTDYDDKLTELINAASAKITAMLNGRELVATDYAAWLDARGADQFVVPQYPILRVNVLATGCASALTVIYGGSDIRATAQVTDTGLRLTSWGTGGATTTEVDWASYETVGEVVTQINDNVADWTAVLKADAPSKWLRPQGGRDAKTAAISIDYPDCIDREYQVKHEPGLIQFRGGSLAMRPTAGMGIGGAYLADGSPWGGLAVLLDYRAGYETIPADVEQVAREMTVAMFDASYQDGTVKSESLGGYSYTLADNAVAANSGVWAQALVKYEREVLA